MNEFVPRDFQKAIHYLTISADQGNSDAQFLLGFIYFDGKFVERNMCKAIYNFSRSSAQNNKDSLFYISSLYGRIC